MLGMSKARWVVVMVRGNGTTEDCSVPFARRSAAERRMQAIAAWAVASMGERLVIEERAA